jgi:hypothetical protein
MNIAVLFTDTQVCSWNMGHGLGKTLERMGHKVENVPMPTSPQATEEQVKQVRASKPPIEYFKQFDAILISGPEHIAPWIEHVWGMYEWKQVAAPKLGWFHESMNRDDFKIDFESLKWVADQWFFPAIQDAEFHDQEMFAKGRSHYLPLGVDTEVFQPGPKLSAFRDAFDVAFIGLLYQKRQIYLKALAQHQIPDIRVSRVMGHTDLWGYDFEGAASLLASNYRAVKVFFNLPAMSRLLVSKVFEVMACGTFLLTPQLVPEAAKNMNLFEDGRDLVYYRASNLPRVAQLLREWSSPEKDAERQRIAEAGCRLVNEKHSLKMRLTEMLSKIAVAQSAP